MKLEGVVKINLQILVVPSVLSHRHLVPVLLAEDQVYLCHHQHLHIHQPRYYQIQFQEVLPRVRHLRGCYYQRYLLDVRLHHLQEIKTFIITKQLSMLQEPTRTITLFFRISSWHHMMRS